MLKSYEEELIDLSERRIKLASKYAIARKAYGEHKAELDILLAGKILKMLELKKNVGYEMAMILLLEQNGEVTQKTYNSMIREYNNYKAIERMIDAYENKITAIQSILRFYRENDGGTYNASPMR